MFTKKITQSYLSKASKRHERQNRYLSQAIQLEEAVNPHIIHATMSMVSLAVIVFIVWAGFTNINEIARTPGEIVPQGYQQTVQHLEGGILKSINVREGDVVQKGQILLVMEGAGIKGDLERAFSRQRALDMQEERMRAYIEGRAPDFSKYKSENASILDQEQIFLDQEQIFTSMRNAKVTEGQIVKDQIIQKRQAIDSLSANLDTAEKSRAITKGLYDRRKKLNQMGYASDVQLLETEQGLNDITGEIKLLESQIKQANQEIEEYEARLESLSAQQSDEVHEKLDQVISQKAENIEIINKLQEQISRLEIRAPSYGLVKGLAVNTVGAVVQPGQTLMEIVPLDKALEVQVKIAPKDIGHIKIGQSVQIKFSTYDFSRYGSVPGKLKQISATTFSAEDGERYYQGLVSLDKHYVGDNPNNTIMPGMTVMADIVTGDKTILQYMLKPIHRAVITAFTER